MGKTELDDTEFELEEYAVLMLGMDSDGEVKLGAPCPMGNQDAMAAIAKKMMETKPVTRVAFVKAEYTFASKE